MIWLSSALLIGLLFAVQASGGATDPKAAVEKLTDELLRVPVHAPDWQEHLRARMKAGWVPPPFPEHIPTDDAPISELIDFWSTDEWGEPRPEKPSERVTRRLLDFCEQNPSQFSGLHWYFDAGRKDVVERIRRCFESRSDLPVKERVAMEEWLLFKAKVLPELLRKRAAEAFDHPADRAQHQALNALMEEDWPAAETMLRQFAKDGQAEKRGLAMLSLYEHAARDSPSAERDALRRELQKFVESDAGADARANALKTLLESEWPGRDKWFIGRFKDEGLAKVKRPSRSMQPTSVFCAIVERAPDLWVSKVVPLVGSTNRTEHNNAVSCLVQFNLESAREEALRPLLPWLSDPDWATDVDEYGRLRLIQSLDRLTIPESVPGLIWALDHGKDFEASGAAEALAHHGAKQAVPALRNAMERATDEHHRTGIIRALLKLTGLTIEEQADGVVAFALQTATKVGREALSKSRFPFDKPAPLRVAVSIGQVISFTDEHDDELVRRLQQRAADLETSKPKTARMVRDMIGSWDTSSSRAQILAQMRSGTLTAGVVQSIMADRPHFAKQLKEEVGMSGASRVLQAVVTNDEKRLADLLAGDDATLQAFLCACARLGRVPLPVAEAAKLLTTKDPLLLRAAESFLECDDSADARRLLLAHHHGQARILGARMGFDPGHFSFSQFSELEEELRKRVRAKTGPEEIVALLSAGYWGDDGQLVIELRSGHGTLVNEQGFGRFRTRSLKDDEVKTLRQFLEVHKVEELPPLNIDVHDGIQFELLLLTKDGGRRVFMNNPGAFHRMVKDANRVPAEVKDGPDDAVYAAVVDAFRKLTLDPSELRVAYRAQRELPGLRVVIRREGATIDAVIKEDDRLLVYALSPGEKQGRWRVMVDEQLGPDPVVGPVVNFSERCGLPEGFSVQDHLVNHAWRASLGGALVLPAADSKKFDALWVNGTGREPRLLAKGTFASPLVTLNQRWIIAAKRHGDSWAKPNSVVRIDAKTGAETTLNLARADTLKPIAIIPHTGKVLLEREEGPRDPGSKRNPKPARREYWLLNADTGEMERAAGEFDPLHHQTWRPLQPTGQPNVVWAAERSPDKKTPSTYIGRYDLSAFKFDPVVRIPALQFASMDAWVDEKAKLIYVVANGDLLTLPLP
jgi:hypothetical protein